MPVFAGLVNLAKFFITPLLQNAPGRLLLSRDYSKLSLAAPFEKYYKSFCCGKTLSTGNERKTKTFKKNWRNTTILFNLII